MRLCFVGWADHVHLERWAGYFADHGDDVAVISVSNSGRYPTNVRQYRLGLESRRWAWRILKLRRLFRQIRPDVVHVHWAHFAHPVARAWSGPLVVTPWGSDVYRLDAQPDATARHLWRGLGAAHAITCDSGDLAQRVAMVSSVGAEKVHLVQWGVDTRLFRPGAIDEALRSELRLDGHRVVLSPRNFRPVYNQETVLRAFRDVRDAAPDTVLVLKNRESEADHVRQTEARIVELGLASAVRILGSVPYERMADLYRLGSVAISVPFSDSTPMSVLEAMACGAVPIVSDLPSLREWIQDGWNGYLVPPQDARQIAERVLHVLKNPDWVERCAERNRKIIDERASQETNMSRMRRIYADLLERAQP